MGGVAGHMNHLYDNLDLTFGQMTDIFNKASEGELVGTEKTDGQNLFVSYSVRDKRAKAARNKGNLKSGGMSAEDLAQKFSGRGNLEKAFVEGFAAFEDAVQTLPLESQIDIFGPDANIFYNAEIMDPRNPNIINYDTKNLVIHRVGHLNLDKETGDAAPYQNDETLATLEGALVRAQREDASDKFGVQVNAIRNLEKFTNKEATEEATQRLSDIMRQSGMSDNNTIGDFIVKEISELVLSNLPDINEEARDMLVPRILGQKGFNLTKIMSNIPKDDETSRNTARHMVKNSGNILKKIVYPLEDVVHDFAVEALRGLESAFILDNPNEIKRLRSEVASAIAAIKGSGSDEAMRILSQQMKKIKSIENVGSAAEGFVFDYDGTTYKFTGNFAPANQILGLFKFGRGNVPPIKKLEEEKEEFNRIVTVFPGKFKPPHTGHLGAVQEVYGNADEIFILISPVEHKGVTPEASKSIWDIYLRRYNLDDMARAFVSTSLFPEARSPVQATYSFLEEFVEEGDKVILVLGEKDIMDGRYQRAIRVGKENGVDVEIRPIPPQAGGMSSSGDMKPAMDADDDEKFKELLPAELTPEEKDEVWNLTKGLQELSAMAAGAVQLGAGKREPKSKEGMIMREEMLAEMKLREFIRKKVRGSQTARLDESTSKTPGVIYINENQKAMLDRYQMEVHLRETIRQLIIQEKSDMPPHRNTGINVLATLLKRIVPVIKSDFKTLTTDDQQRKSYRSHVINQTVRTLAPIELADEADEEAAKLQEIDIDVGDDDAGKFIDVGDDSFAKTPEEEKFETLPGLDMTGRNVAEKTFDNIGKQIVDAYAVLDNNKDQSMFYEYLIANLKLYFDKFEKELPAAVPEPTNAAYEAEKESPGPEGEEVIEEPPMEEPLQEKSVSKAQQGLFGAAKACKEKEGPCKGAAANIAANVSSKKIDDFAGTKTKGLPKKKKNNKK